MPVRVEGRLADWIVVGAAAGDCCTAVWTSSGHLWTFGCGNQLGHGGEEDEFVPRMVRALAGKKVIGASAGGGHTSAWTDAGELFTFGNGDNGQLGHGGEEDESVPRLVEALAAKKVVGASAGILHTAAWTDEGELFTFGNGYYGELGHGGEESESVPRLVEALAAKKVVGASAGGLHTAAWTDAGELFTFGNGHEGMLGHGGDEDESVPRLVEALAGKKVVGVSAGRGQTVIWTEEAEVFTFGYGWHGALGHGGNENEYVPRLVEAMIDPE